MDSFEFNKFAMAVLGVVFIVMSLMFVSDSLFHAELPETQGYAVEVAEASTDDGAEEDTGPAFEPITALLASADAAAGEKIFSKCSSCHTNVEGGANKAGPALWGIVENQVAVNADFKYSQALIDYGQGKTWTYEELNGFLWKPKTYVKGTKMGFAGIKKVEDRAAIVAYLRTLASNPAPLPQ